VKAKKSLEIAHCFIDLLPDTLEERTLYVSVEYKSIIHLCFCGCGKKVVTPLSPTGWSMTFDGKTVSLYPSIGNWNLACRSHYWIRNSRVQWADEWSQTEVDAGFARDAALKHDYYAKGDARIVADASDAARRGAGERRLWTTLKDKLPSRRKKR
jgi:hypothetical protein